MGRDILAFELWGGGGIMGFKGLREVNKYSFTPPLDVMEIEV